MEQPFDDTAGLLRVGSKTPPDKLAGSIANAVYERTPNLRLRAIGHGAVGQAMKAVAIARGYVAPRAIDLLVMPGFEDIEVPKEGGGKEMTTSMLFKIVTR